MKIADHFAKAERITASLSRCTVADYETVIEAAMLAGTHWFNLALHAAKLRPEEADAMHSEFLSVGERRKIEATLPGLLAPLDAIEELRTGYVRGDLPEGEMAASRALANLSELGARARALLAGQ
jgi:hypothetical protein